MAESVFGQSELHQVLGQCVVEHVHLVEDLGCGLRVPAQEVERQRPAESEIQFLKHPAFHGQHVLACVRLIRHVDKVVDLWCPRLLELGRDEHGGEANQLQLSPVDSRINLKKPRLTNRTNGKVF